MDYVGFLRKQAPGEPGRPHHYEGVLVGHHVSADAGEMWRDLAASSGVVVRSWVELLDVAERTHREFLDAVKQRAPEDARIQMLPPVEGGEAAGAEPTGQA